MPPDRLRPGERRLGASRPTPEAVQAWLRRLPYNWERNGETLRTLREILRHRRAHCAESALAAAAILRRHGFPPLLLDLESVDGLDHVLFLFRRHGKWGTVAKSRDPGLFGRKPVFPDLRSLVDDYAAPYVDDEGRIKGYGVLDLRRLPRQDWDTARGDVWWVEEALYAMRHTRYKMANSDYERWKTRYDRFKERNPKGRPTYFPRRDRWM